MLPRISGRVLALHAFCAVVLSACGGSDDPEIVDAGPDANDVDGGGSVDVEPTCTDECATDGEATCDDARTVVICADHDEDGCLELGNPTSCQGALFCVDGACVDTNTPPTAGEVQVSTPEDTPLTIEVPGSDAQSEQLLFEITAGPSSGTLSGRLPSLVYTPAPDFNGEDVIEFTVSDRIAPPVAGRVVINVTPVNDAPVATPADYSGDEDTAVEGLLNGSDIDGDDLTFTVVTAPAEGDLTLESDGSFRYLPALNFAGDVAFAWKANDGTADSAPVIGTIRISPINDRPVALAGDLTVQQDFEASVLLQGEDPEGSDLSYRVTVPPVNGTLTGEAPALVYVPDPGVSGSDSFTFVVNDGELDSEPGEITVLINENRVPPQLTAANQTLEEDSDVTFAVGISDEDTPAALLSVDVIIAPANGSLERLADGRWRYVPNADFHGTDTATLRGSDGALFSDSLVVQFDVLPVNDAPTAAPLLLVGDEDEPLEFLAEANDVDGDSLAWSVVTLPTAGTLTGNAPELTYVPELDDNGDVTFDLSVSDGTAPAVRVPVTVTIRPVNDAPVGADSTAQTDEDVALAGRVTATDVDADDLVYLLVDPPADGDVTLNDDGTWSYLGTENFAGVDEFTWRADDGNALSDTYRVVITVNPVNDAPVVLTRGASTFEDNVVDIELTVFDPDGDPTEISQVTVPANGTASEVDTLKVRYTPDANWNGTDSFSVTVTDSQLESAPALITVDVTPVNDAPSIDDINRTAFRFDRLTGTIVVTDVEGDAVRFRTLTSSPAGFWTLAQTGAWTYIAEETGVDPILVQVKETGSSAAVFVCSPTETVPADWFCDGEIDCSNGRDECTDAASCAVLLTAPITPCAAPVARALSSRIATATFTVEALPDPVAVDDTLPYLGNTPVLYPVGTLTANDSHPLGRAFTAVAGSVETAGGGSAVIFADGSFRYTPAPGYRDDDFFLYSISLTTGENDTGRVNLQMEHMYQYVDNRVLEPGDGTLLQPWATLSQAAESGAEGDILFVFAGDASYAETDAVLQPHQAVYGEPVGVSLTLPSDVVLTIVPPGENLPVLTPVVGGGPQEARTSFPFSEVPAIEVTDGTEIRSVACEASEFSYCFVGAYISDVRISDVNTFGGRLPIKLAELLGNVHIENVTIQDASSNAILLTVSSETAAFAEPVQITVQNVTVGVTEAPQSFIIPNGIRLSLNSGSQSSALFSDIEVTGVETGFDLNGSPSSLADVQLLDVRMQDISYQGLQVFADEFSAIDLTLRTDDGDEDSHSCEFVGVNEAGSFISNSGSTIVTVRGCSFQDVGNSEALFASALNIFGSGEFQVAETTMQNLGGGAVGINPSTGDAQYVSLDMDLDGVGGYAVNITTNPAFGRQVVQLLSSTWTGLNSAGVYIWTNNDEPVSPTSGDNLALLVQDVTMTPATDDPAPGIRFDFLSPTPVNVCARILGNTLPAIAGGPAAPGDLFVEGADTSPEEALTLANIFTSPSLNDFGGIDTVIPVNTCNFSPP